MALAMYVGVNNAATGTFNATTSVLTLLFCA
jgi:hypothetical protein